MTSIDNLAEEIMQGLQEYADLADTAMKKAVRKTATQVKNEISANAPKDTGKYAKSWATKKTGENSHSLEMTVHSKNRYQLMEEMGLPFAYHHYAEGESPAPPFLLFLSPGENPFSADNVAYFSCKQLDIELYTDKKQPELEEQVEAVLAQHEIYYTKTELFIDSEELYEVLYEMEV